MYGSEKFCGQIVNRKGQAIATELMKKAKHRGVTSIRLCSSCENKQPNAKADHVISQQEKLTELSVDAN